MPNPLIGSARLNTGKRADDRPHAVPPVPEEYEGTNFPYRGTNEHGVEPHSMPHEFLPEWDDTVSGEYEPEIAPVDPVPVRVVERYTRELKTWQPIRTIIPALETRMILGQDNTRTSAVITNLGTETIYIGDTVGVRDYTGFPVNAGGTFSFGAETAVYAYATVDTGIAIAVESTVRER